MSSYSAPCKEIEGDLLAGTRGELDADSAARVTRHLAECPGCRAEEARIRAVADLFARVPVVTPAAGSFAKLMQKVESQRAPRGRARWFVLSGATLAAAACLILFLSLRASPATPAAELLAMRGEVLINGATARPGALSGGDEIAAGSMALLQLRSSRRMKLTLAAGTRLAKEGPGAFRVLSGRLLVEVLSGRETARFSFPGGTVEVTGTVFDMNLSDAGTVVSVLEGAVLVRTGDKPVRVDSGASVTITDGGQAQAPVAADPWRVRKWCSTPTFSSALNQRLLTLTFVNENVSPLVLSSFDPATATYSLLADGPRGRLPIVVQESVVVIGGRAPGQSGYITLAPGESYRLVIDLDRVKLDPGEYWVSAVYRPYGDLPPDAWRGSLTTTPVRVVIE